VRHGSLLTFWRFTNRIIIIIIIVTKRNKDLCRILYRTKDHLAYFSENKKWLVAATPFISNFGSTGPLWSKIADFEPIFARSASEAAPSKNLFIYLFI